MSFFTTFYEKFFPTNQRDPFEYNSDFYFPENFSNSNDSYFSKISNTVSNTISKTSDYITNASLSKTIATVLSPITKLGVLAASSAVVTSVGKTIADAAIKSVINTGSDPIKKTLLSGITKDIFISNAKSSLWGLLIFGIIFPILHGLIQDQQLQVPIIPNDHTSAVKLGYKIGKLSTISTAIWGASTSLIAKVAPTSVTNLVFTFLSFYGFYKMVSYFIPTSQGQIE